MLPRVGGRKYCHANCYGLMAWMYDGNKKTIALSNGFLHKKHCRTILELNNPNPTADKGKCGYYEQECKKPTAGKK